MPEFLVEVREVHVSIMKIEASDRDEAVLRAHEGSELSCEYSRTLEPETWAVAEAGSDKTYYYNDTTGKYDKTIG